jgi:ABC-2 type transport system permease protein
MVFYLSSVLSVYVVFILSSQAFLAEKRYGRIEVLLCTPVTLKIFWFGKILGVLIPAYAVGLIAGGIVFAAMGFIIPGPLDVHGPVLLYLLIGLPVLLVAVTGVFGFFQLLLGMKENRIFNLAFFIGIFILLGIAQTMTRAQPVISWGFIGTVMLIAFAVMAVVSYAFRFLSKEKIITTLEE